MKVIFLRIGEIPPTGKSRIRLRGDVIGKENGVSVWEAVYYNGRYRVLLPNPANENTVDDLHQMLSLPHRPTPVYEVNGDVIGVGSDGEPILSNVRIVKKLSNKIEDIFLSN